MYVGSTEEWTTNTKENSFAIYISKCTVRLCILSKKKCQKKGRGRQESEIKQSNVQFVKTKKKPKKIAREKKRMNMEAIVCLKSHIIGIQTQSPTFQFLYVMNWNGIERGSWMEFHTNWFIQPYFSRDEFHLEKDTKASIYLSKI